MGVWGIWAMRPTGGMGYRGMSNMGNSRKGGMGYRGMGHMGNEAQRGKVVQGYGVHRQ